MKSEEIKPGQTWEHFKGGEYKIIGVAKYSEDESDLVIYEAQYDNKLSKLWARPIDDFLGYKIKEDGTKIKRFKLIK